MVVHHPVVVSGASGSSTDTVDHQREEQYVTLQYTSHHYEAAVSAKAAAASRTISHNTARRRQHIWGCVCRLQPSATNDLESLIYISHAVGPLRTIDAGNARFFVTCSDKSSHRLTNGGHAHRSLA